MTTETNTLVNILNPKNITHIVDIGANPIDGDAPYKKMLDLGLCYVTGFEPQPDALAALNSIKSENESYLPYAVGDGNERILNICRGSGMTSLLEPNKEVLNLFSALSPLAEITKRVRIKTHKLDKIDLLSNIDFLKIDIQGGELDVFKNGQKQLASAVAIQTEVSFIGLYENQPTIGDIDIELRHQGFIPHCFAAIKQWPISPCIINNNPRQPLNQLLEADIVYVRDITKIDNFSNEQLKQLALIAHYVYNSFDLTLRCIFLLENRSAISNDSQTQYLKAFNQ